MSAVQEVSPLLWSTAWTFVSLVFLLVICFQYDTILSVYIKECNEYGSQCVFIPLQGVGFFSAGYLSNGETVPGAKPGDNRVLWSDLTSENACQPGTDTFTRYSMPLDLCHKTEHGTYELVIPTAIKNLQLSVRVAIMTSFASVVSGVAYLCFDAPRLAITAIGMSAAAILTSIRCIFLWSRWKGTELYTSQAGFYLPLWATDGQSLMVERFSLQLNNPQFQLLVATVPSFAVGLIGTLCVALRRQRLRSYVAIDGTSLV